MEEFIMFKKIAIIIGCLGAASVLAMEMPKKDRKSVSFAYTVPNKLVTSIPSSGTRKDIITVIMDKEDPTARITIPRLYEKLSLKLYEMIHQQSSTMIHIDPAINEAFKAVMRECCFYKERKIRENKAEVSDYAALLNTRSESALVNLIHGTHYFNLYYMQEAALKALMNKLTEPKRMQEAIKAGSYGITCDAQIAQIINEAFKLARAQKMPDERKKFIRQYDWSSEKPVPSLGFMDYALLQWNEISWETKGAIAAGILAYIMGGK
jgi:hypothetical protein